MISTNFKTYMEHYQDAEKGQLDPKIAGNLPEEFNRAAMEKVREAKTLADRVKAIQAADKGTDKAARYLKAFGWGALAAVGVITVVPAIAYAVTGLILQKDPLNWSRRLSLKPEEQLEVEKKWSTMREEWVKTPLQSPYRLEDTVPLEQSSTATARCRAAMVGLNKLFDSKTSLDSVERLGDNVLENVRLTVVFPQTS
jgi:hypothetical protein